MERERERERINLKENVLMLLYCLCVDTKRIQAEHMHGSAAVPPCHFTSGPGDVAGVLVSSLLGPVDVFPVPT